MTATTPPPAQPPHEAQKPKKGGISLRDGLAALAIIVQLARLISDWLSH